MPGGEVERPRDPRAPVDHQRGAFVVLVGLFADSDTPDVVPGSVGEINTAEAEPGFHRIQRAEQPGPFGDQHIALDTRLQPLAHLGERALDGGFGALPERVQPLVEP